LAWIIHSKAEINEKSDIRYDKYEFGEFSFMHFSRPNCIYMLYGRLLLALNSYLDSYWPLYSSNCFYAEMDILCPI
jgi:hypothetical protein